MLGRTEPCETAVLKPERLYMNGRKPRAETLLRNATHPTSKGINVQRMITPKDFFGNEAPIPGSTASQLGFGRFPDLSSSQSAFPFASEQWQKMWMGHAKAHSSGHCSGLEPDSLFTTGREATHRHQIRDKSNGIFRLSVSKPAKTWSEDPAPLFAVEAIKPLGGVVCLACLPASGLWQTRGDEPLCGRCRSGAP